MSIGQCLGDMSQHGANGFHSAEFLSLHLNELQLARQKKCNEKPPPPAYAGGGPRAPGVIVNRIQKATKN